MNRPPIVLVHGVWIGRRVRAPPRAPRLAAAPRCAIDCAQLAPATIAPTHLRVRQMPGFEVLELPPVHCPMVSSAPALVAVLLQLAAF